MATRGTKITGLNDLETVTGNIIIPVVDPTVTLATPDGQTLQATVQQLGNYILQEAGNLFPEAKVANTVSNPAQPNITSLGTLTGLTVNGSNITLINGVYNGNGSGLSSLTGANVTGTVANANHSITANTVTTAAQPNITSVGILSSLQVTGNISSNANVSVSETISANNITATSNISASILESTVSTGLAPIIVASSTLVANLNADLLDGLNTSSSDIPSTVVNRDSDGSFSANIIRANAVVANVVTAKIANGTSNIDIPFIDGDITISVSGNANVARFSGSGFTVNGVSDLGDISNVKIYGGANRAVLVTDGLGNLSWGPDVVASGPNTAVQFNDEGNFAGSINFTFNKNTNTLGVTNATISQDLNFSSVSGGQISFTSPNTANIIDFIVPDTIGTRQQVLGVIDQTTQQLGWKTVPVYYITVGMRDGSSYSSSPNPVLRVYPVRQRDGSFLNIETTQ